MVELIIGEKGKGKTKVILDKAEVDQKNAQGDIVFIDKDDKHIFGLSNKTRLINLSEFEVCNTDQFMGFLNGVISLNHDIEEIILDSFLTIAFIDSDDAMVSVVDKIEDMSNKHDVKFVLSVSRSSDALPKELASKVVTAL